VGGIPYEWDLSKIRRTFSRYGTILDIHLKHGYCFVEYDHYKDAEEAIYRTDGGKIFGRRYVYFCLLFHLIFVTIF
jgi:RNA recognition motif-containing protein